MSNIQLPTVNWRISMNGLQWTPWHEVVQLREDLKNNELPLSMFAADVYDVVLGRAQAVYQRPEEFFALTYPTYNLRQLMKDVLLRLAGKTDKVVRQLELTYGGGKTHTLITAYHLVRDSANLPNLPAVKEFVEHAGVEPPQARVAILAFDKLDVEKGMEIVSPDGKKRWLRQPWSVLAWQIAGPEGLKVLHPDNKPEERDSVPAENLMDELLRLPERDGLATLVLIDEVLMYAREKVRLDPAWRDALQSFFQSLTQAAAKSGVRCCIVASLLATDPAKSDELGRAITADLYAIFRRENEEGIQPVEKTDVAEVLRRRFFKPESIADPSAFRPHVTAALRGICDLDEQTKKEGAEAEERFLASYPFHPDLTEVLYAKWTNLEGFQRTRGVLRTFALALRDAERWDKSPLVSCNVFLTEPGESGLSHGLQELTKIAGTDGNDGTPQNWSAIMEGELEKARRAQADYSGVRHRDVEQAVVATFLHSQPIGQKASTPEVMVLIGHTRPDRIEIGNAMLRWGRESWFVDEQLLSEAGGDKMPQYWRLGSKPNLRQMHSDACRRVSSEVVRIKLENTIREQKSLTAGAAAAIGRPGSVHTLPERPSDIGDEGEFHYAVLGPSAASMSGNPSAEAKRFIAETTSPDRPRSFRNAVVLAVPSRDGLEMARDRVREYLGWEDVRTTLKQQQDEDADPVRTALLAGHLKTATDLVSEAVRQAYCIVVTVSEKDEVQAFKIAVGSEPLFTIIKGDSRSRIQDQPINAEALLPDGPYNLWQPGEQSRLVKDLVGAFAYDPRLPKMLRRQDIVATLSLGAKQGLFVLRATRPDQSVRTLWLQEPTEVDLEDPGLEVVLPEAAELTELSSHLLAPGTLAELWPEEQELSVADVYTYFAGKVVQVPKEGYTEPLVIPKAERSVVETAIRLAVEQGLTWLISGPASLFREPIPAGVLSDAANLLPPPATVPVTDVLPEALPEAWEGQEANALGILVALSAKAGRTLPWVTVSDAIDGAVRARYLERPADSGPWPCEVDAARNAKFRLPTGVPPPPPPDGMLRGEAELSIGQIQDLAEVVAGIKQAAIGHGIRFVLVVELGGEKSTTEEVADKISGLLKKVSEELELK
jgi:hypothetical protein